MSRVAVPLQMHAEHFGQGTQEAPVVGNAARSELLLKLKNCLLNHGSHDRLGCGRRQIGDYMDLVQSHSELYSGPVILAKKPNPQLKRKTDA